MTYPLKINSKQEFEKNNVKPNQKKVWDNIAQSWKTNRKNKIPIVEEFLAGKKGKIIDFGCGTGRNMNQSEKITYYGVDFSQEQLRYAEEYTAKNNIHAELFCLDITKLDKKTFKNEMFDYGLCIAAIHCVETQRKRKKTIEEFYRVLKPGAEALITVWNARDKRFNHVNHHGDIYLSWVENNNVYMRYYYLFDKDELATFLTKAGFKILEWYAPREKDRFSKKNWIVRVKK